MYPMERDIFSSLYRWVDKQHENFLSESLAYVFRILLNNSPAAAIDFLGFITNMPLENDFNSGQAQVTAQMHTEEYGTPDIWISLPDFDVAIEVKVDASLGADQLSSYRSELKKRGKSKQCLVYLSRYIAGEEAGDADVTLRWFQVADALDDLLTSNSLDPASRFIIAQFIEHLRFRRLAFAPMRSSVSKGIREHFASEKPIFTSRVRNLDLLLDHQELEPLFHLLSLMRAAIDSLPIDDKPILDSGQTGPSWIGYNIQQMKYYFFIHLTHPEVIVFQTFSSFDMDKEKFGNLDSGRFVKRTDFDSWENQLDLLDPSLDFFSLPSDQQIDIITSFLVESYDNALSIMVNQTGT